jgi:SAM-dependent methyltransferase
LYPIVRFIPRLLSAAFEQEPEFCQRYREAITGQGGDVTVDESVARQRGTMQSFGREWTSYEVQRPEEDLAYFLSKTGINPVELHDKLVLDAGCGSGRYARVAGESDATVIGIDLSLAVDTAYATTCHLPNVHIIQADIFRLPFAASTFDFIYSIGVLHHTPDTKGALDQLIPLLNENGEIAIWLYPRWPAPVEAYNGLLRALTTRLSLDHIHRLAVWLEPLGLLKLRLLTARHAWQRLLGLGLRGLTIGVSYHPDREIRICDTFDWFSPPYQWHHTDAEVEAWLRGYGLAEIVNLSINQQQYQFNYGNGVNFKARRIASI